jgi:hypothetical protein
VISRVESRRKRRLRPSPTATYLISCTFISSTIFPFKHHVTAGTVFETGGGRLRCYTYHVRFSHSDLPLTATKLTDRDLADARSDDFEKRRAVADHIRHACLTAGFFYGKLGSASEDSEIS